jgi:hypothetical protein
VWIGCVIRTHDAIAGEHGAKRKPGKAHPGVG